MLVEPNANEVVEEIPNADEEVEEIPRNASPPPDPTIPSMSEQNQVPKAGPFLLPTPPPHMRLNWRDDCACQQSGSFRNPKSRSRKRKKFDQRKKSPNVSPSSDELLIDLN